MTPILICTPSDGQTVKYDDLPREDAGNAALMVNPDATAAILADAASARLRRVMAITDIFNFINPDATESLPADVLCRVLAAIQDTTHEATRLLDALQAIETPNDGANHG